MALTTIVSSGIYNCRVIDNTASLRQPKQELILVNELQSSSNVPVAMYISQYKSYSENDCRAIYRKIVNCIKIMHDAGLAHRNLHLGNVLTDIDVRKAFYYTQLWWQHSHFLLSTMSESSIRREILASRVCALLNSFVKLIRLLVILGTNIVGTHSKHRKSILSSPMTTRLIYGVLESSYVSHY
jgi:serine/threonine protein kinase